MTHPLSLTLYISRMDGAHQSLKTIVAINQVNRSCRNKQDPIRSNVLRIVSAIENPSHYPFAGSLLTETLGFPRISYIRGLKKAPEAFPSVDASFCISVQPNLRVDIAAYGFIFYYSNWP